MANISTECSPLPQDKWFQPCNETINSPELKEKCLSTENNQRGQFKCQSASMQCSTPSLKGFEFCHKHILEDSSSPFKCCSYISKTDNQQCSNPAPKLGDKKSYCMQHEEEMKEAGKNKKKKKKAKSDEKRRLSNLTLVKKSNKNFQDSSSEEEDYSFFTNSASQVHKMECVWLGNQASDAESTDSEDDNPLDHAGVWTLEECVRICKEKMTRLRWLYAQQYRRLNYYVREERRKMLNDYDMDPYVLSKVEFQKSSGNDFTDYLVDVHLTNYQRASSGVERIVEKRMKDKRSKGLTLHSRRADLPRCQANKETSRCSNRVLPFSKFCYQHICNDSEQFLYIQCTHGNKRTGCSNPADIFSKTCGSHIEIPTTSSTKLWESFESVRKARDTRKRKREEKERSRRTSVRLKDNVKESWPKYNESTSSQLITVETKLSPMTCDVLADIKFVLEDILNNIDDGRKAEDEEDSSSVVDIVSEATLSSEEILEYDKLPEGLKFT